MPAVRGEHPSVVGWAGHIMTEHTGVAATAVAPPIAPRIPKVDIIHGDRREDDYFWLREKDNPAVLAYLRAENAYTDSVMKPTEAFQAALYDEMLARIK